MASYEASDLVKELQRLKQEVLGLGGRVDACLKRLGVGVDEGVFALRREALKWIKQFETGQLPVTPGTMGFLRSKAVADYTVAASALLKDLEAKAATTQLYGRSGCGSPVLFAAHRRSGDELEQSRAVEMVSKRAKSM